MAEQNTNKLNKDIIKFVNSVSQNSNNSKSAAVQKIVQKLNSKGVESLNKEEAQQLQSILSENVNNNPEVQNLLGQFSQVVKSSTIKTGQLKEINNIQDSIEKAAIKEFQEDVSLGINNKEAVGKATEKAYTKAIEMGASDDVAKSAALKARETLLNQIVETSGLEEVQDIRAEQIDFNALRNAEKSVEKVEVGVKANTPNATKAAPKGSANTSSETISDQANVPQSSTENTSNVATETNPTGQNTSTTQEVSSNPLGGNDSTLGGTPAPSQNLNSFSLQGGNDDVAEQVLSGGSGVNGQSSIVLGASGDTNDPNVQNISFEGGTREVTQNLGDANIGVTNSDLVGNFVSQEVDASGNLQTQDNDLGQSQETSTAGDFTNSNVGGGEVSVDIVDVEVVAEPTESEAIVIVEVPPSAVSVEFDEVKTDPTGETAIFTFEITKDFIGNPSTIKWELEGVAAEDVKINWPTETLSFSGTELSKTITVEIPGALVTNDEMFTIKITPLDPLTFLNNEEEGQATKRVFNEDAKLSIESSQAQLRETEETEHSTFEFVVTRDRVGGEGSVNWSIKDAEANGLTPEDFVNGVLPSGVVNFVSGQTSQIVQVLVQGDRLVELNETLKLEISTPSSLLEIDTNNQEAQTVVFNEDTDWSLNLISERSIDEEDIGVSTYEFTITREGFIDQIASINYVVSGSGENAADQNDFVDSIFPNGVVNFLAGETTKTVTISIARDHILEATENFKLTISDIQATGGQDIVVAEQELTIVNDDNTLALTTSTPALAETDQGTTEFVFTVTRTGDIRSVGTVDYAVTGQDGLNATDFIGNVLPTGTIQLPANEATVTVTIPVSGDITIENNDTFLVTLSNPSSGFTIADATENATIIADDIHFNLTGPSSDNQLEVDTNATNDYEFTITRTGDLRFAKTVEWTVAGSGTNPIANEEFVALAGSVEFATGETTKTVTVQIKGDLIGDPQESFTLSMQAPNEPNVYTGITSIEASIIDNEAIIHITSNQTSVVEGDTGAVTEHVFTVTRSGYLEIPASVDYSIESLAGVSADDFVGSTLPSGSVAFAANETVKTITIQIQGDRSTEANETFTVNLKNGSKNVDIQGPNASSTIVSDDADIRIDALSNNSFETFTGATTTISWEVSRNHSDGASSVDWSLEAGNFELSDVGGTLPTGTISFADGETKKVIQINIPGDERIETDKSYTLELSNAGSNSSLDMSAFQATNIVKNDDIGFNLNAVSNTSLEGNSNTNQLTYKVIRSVDLDKALDIQFMVDSIGSNGVEANDFVNGSDTLDINGLPSGIVSFGVGETEKLITISLSGDSIVGNDESMAVRLINAPAESHILINNISGTIQNDDSLVTFTTSATEIAEGNTSSNSITLTFTRAGNLLQAAQFDYSVTGYGEDASLVNDFLNNTFPSGTVQFAANEASKAITLNTSNDSIFEGKEFFKIDFSNFVGTEVQGSGSVFTMNPDDSVLSLNATNAILAEGGTSTKGHTFTVSRTGDSTFETTVNYVVKAAANSSADATDFSGVFPSGTVTLAAGETSKIFTITPSADYTLESNENYVVEISSTQAGVSILKPNADGTIVNDESGIGLVDVSLTSTETDTGNKNFEFKVERSGSVSGVSTVDWKVLAGDTNTVDINDFVGGKLPSGSLKFDQGEKSKTIAIVVKGDSSFEASENFKVSLENPSTGSSLTISELAGQIKNDDVKISLTSNQASKQEGQTGNTDFTFTLTREGDLTGTDSVNYAVTATGTNQTSTNDFVGNAFPSGVVNFAAGETTKIITVQIATDSTQENDESFKIDLSSPSVGVELGTSTATVIVANDDDELSLSSNINSIVEGDGTGGTLTYTVTRTGNLDTTTTVNYGVTGSGANASSASDFKNGVLPTGTLTFAANETSKVITIELAGDNSVENDEGLTLTLSNPSSGTSLGTTSQTGTIVNEDSGLSIAATSTNVAEGSGSNSTHTFTVTRSGKLDTSNTVDWTVAGVGTNAANAGDFVDTSGQVTFAANETSKTITLQAIGDTTVESNEDFTVTLSAGTANDQLITSSANGVIKSDDAGLTIAAVDASKAEGTSGANTNVTFTVTRNGNTASTATSNWALSGDVNAADFGGTLPSGTVTFNPGVLTQTITLALSGDKTFETNENLIVTLSGANSGTYLNNTSASTIITNDDSKLDFTNPTLTIVEGNTGTTDVTYTVTRSGDTSIAATSKWKASGVNTNPARAEDFSAGQDVNADNSGLPSGLLTFAANETTKTFTISVKGDIKVEENETFKLEFYESSANTDITASSPTITIPNEDPGVSLSAVQTTQAEGDTGTTKVKFEVVRSGDLGSIVEVNYAVSGDVNAADFVGTLPSGKVTFAANQTKIVLELDLQADTIVENSENLLVTISNAVIQGTATTVNITQATANTMINNEDESFAVSVSTASLVEGAAGQQIVDYTITRTGDLTKSVTLNYALTSDNGGDNSDINGSLPTGTVTFAANETTKKVSIQVLGDNVVENNENMTLTISSPSEGIITTAAVTSVITNDDTSFDIVATNATHLEGHSGTTAMTFTVTRNGFKSGAATVNYAVTGDNNLTTADFVGSSLPSGQVSFADGEATKTLTINVSGDTALESNENFVVTISNPSVGILGSNKTATTTITSDDDQVAIQAMTSTVTEGHSGTKNVVFKVTRSDSTTTQSTVKYTLTGLDAADFAAGTKLTDTITFATGETTKDITFVLKGDTTVETDETLLMTLSDSSTGTNIKTATANTIINNDDAEFVLAAQAAAKAEGNSGTVPFTFTVTRSGHTVQSNTVQWRLTGTGVDAASADDFSTGDTLADNGGFPSGTVSFASGETSKTITINVAGDSKFEQNEDFTIALSNPSAGSIVKTGTAVGEIQNDDALLNFASTSLTKDEVDSGATTTYTYTLNRTGNTTQQSNVNWQITGSNGFSTSTTHGDLSSITIGGSAVSGTSGTIAFTSGQTSKTVVIKVKGDNTIENDEAFAFNLSSASSGTEIGTNSSASGTVTNDDTRLDFSSQISQAEGISGTTQFVYTVTRTGRVDRTTSFNWAVSAYDPTGSSNDASSSSDFVSGFQSGSLTFTSGQTIKTITINVKGDSTIEDDEWFKITASGVNGAESYESYVYGEIKRDEAQFDIIDAEVTAVGNSSTISHQSEGELGQSTVTRVFAVKRHISTSGTPSFDWKVSDTGGIAEPDTNDFVAGQDALTTNGGYPSGRVTFAEGETYAYFTVVTTVDNNGEDDEYFEVVISNPSTGNQIIDSTMTAGIMNDDPLFRTQVDTITVTEGTDAGFTEKVITVLRTGDTKGIATVDWATDVTGTETTNEGNTSTGTWYLADASDFKTGDVTSGTLTFADGVSSQTVTLRINNDSLSETYQEEFDFDLSNPVAGVGSDPVFVSQVHPDTDVTIIDNDGDPTVSITADAASKLEGTGGTTQLTYTLTRTDDTGRDGALNYPTTIYWYRGGGSDISTSYNGYITFASGETTKTITLDVNEDDDIESNENVTVYISQTRSSGTGSGPAQISSTNSTATTTITNDDIRLWANNVSVLEGDTGTTNLSFTVTRRGYTGTDVSFNYNIDTGSGLSTESGDFTGPKSGTLTIPSGETSKTFTIAVVTTNSTKEGDETFEIDLSSPTAGALFHQSSNTTGSSTMSIEGTIEDDDTPFHINKSGDNTQSEQDTGQTRAFNFTITRDTGGDDDSANVQWKVVGNGTHQADAADFTTSDGLGNNGGLPSGTAYFSSGVYTKTITVYVTGDTKTEFDEGFKVVIQNPNTGKISTAEATAVIETDDTGIAIADGGTVVEGDSGTKNINFVVTRSGDLSVTSTANWAVSHEGTTAADFTGDTSGTVTFTSGQSSKTITVKVTGDTDVENLETFKVNLSNLVQVDEALDVQATASIANDEANFSITKPSADQNENAGAQTFTITRDKDTSQAQTVRWTVSGTEINAADFGGALPTNTVTFNAGELTKTISIDPSSDTTGEANESYNVTITDPGSTTGVKISASNKVSSSIVNDDAVLNLSVTSNTYTEGDATSNFTFVVTRSGVTTGTASVKWALSSQSGGLTLADFVTGQDVLTTNSGFPSGTINWVDGETTKNVTVQVVGDRVVEDADTFRITLSGATNADLAVSTQDIVISKEDSSLALSADSAVKAEGDTGTTNYTFTITRTGDITSAGTVDYAVTGTGGLDATDFIGGALPSGTVTLAANQATTTVTIAVKGDTSAEINENFTLTLSNASSTIALSDATEVGTIQTDDTRFDVSGPTANNLVEKNTGENTDFLFTVTRIGNLGSSQTVNWGVAGTTTNGVSNAEFTATSGSVTFGVNETSKVVTISTIGDIIGETNESFKFSITAPTGTTTGTSFVEATLVENEAVLAIVANQTALVESSDTNFSTFTFTVTRTGNTSTSASADYAVATSGTLTAADFENSTLPTGTVTFAANETTKTITVKVKGDATVETNESFTLTLSNPATGTALTTSTASSVITNDDTDWVLAVSGAGLTQNEGDTGVTNYTATVTRSGDINKVATIDYATIGFGTNLASAADIQGNAFPSSTLNFASGETTKTITIAVIGDSVAENTEGFRLTLSNPTGSGTHNITNATLDYVITNDDDVMSITSSQTSITEQDTSDVDFTFTVTRTGSLVGSSTVNWKTANTSAIDTSDFSQTTGLVTFANGESSKEITIKVKGDTLVETNENFTIELHTPGSGSKVSTTNGSINSQIVNQDIDLTPTSTNLIVSEGDANNGQFIFTVTRSGDSSGVTTVDYNLVNQTTDINDFLAGQDILTTNSGLPSGRVTFQAGETTKQVTIGLKGDGVLEVSETYQVTLTNASGNAEINNGTLNATVRNDDDGLSIAAVDASKVEGEAGDVTNFGFKVDRSSSFEGEASVTWTLTGTGGHPVDASRFVATTGTVTLADGETTKGFNVQLNGDEAGAYDEGFTVTLSSPSLGSTIQTATALGTVINDDPVLFVATATPTIVEGDTGGFITYTITRSGDLTITTQVNFGVGGNGDNAASESDFGGEFPNGLVTFAPGESSKTIAIPINTDANGEFNESFALSLSGANGADVLEGVANTTLVNDDTAFLIQEAAVEKLEGDATNTTFDYVVTRTGPLTGTSTVDWTLNPSGEHHVNGADFVGGAIPSGSLTFAPNETTKTITFQTKGDAIAGQTETFTVDLSNPTGADIIRASANGKVIDDDSLVFVTIDQATQNESDSGTTDYVFKVARSGNLNQVATVNYKVEASSEQQAEANDFDGGVFPTGLVSFAAGESEKLVTIKIKGDTNAEATEAFKFTLENGSSNVTIKESATTVNAIITNDDQGAYITTEDNKIDEGDTQNQAFTFEVNRVGNVDQTLSMDWVVAGTGANATDATDFVSTTGTIDFGAGEVSKQLTIYSTADTVVEQNEDFTVSISKTGVDVIVASVQGTVIDDDSGFKVVARETNVNEEVGAVVFDITRTGSSANSVDIDYILTGSGNSGVDAVDFTETPMVTSSVTFAAGETSKTVTVNLVNDTLVETTELMALKISTTSTARIIDNEAIVIVNDNDVATAGDDQIFGDKTAQLLQGLAGNDTIYGDQGADTLVGGEGNDTFVYNNVNEGGDYISDFEVAKDKFKFESQTFQNLNVTSKVNQTKLADLQTTIDSLAAQADSDLYTVDVKDLNFVDQQGAAGSLDELEAAFTAGNHTGAAFIGVSDGNSTTLYYDADTSTGTDGTGLVEIAQVQSIDQADELVPTHFNPVVGG